MSCELLTKKEVMARLKVCRRTVDRMRKKGQLPYLDLATGRKPLVRFKVADIVALENQAWRTGDRPETSAKKGEEWLTAGELAKFLGIGLEDFGRMLFEPALLRLHRGGQFPLSKVVEYLDGNIDKEPSAAGMRE
jgi:hypothetical protein